MSISDMSHGLGERVRKRRTALKMSQKRLAEEVTRRGINLSQQNVNSIESGVVARPRALPELASVLETTIEWLQKGEGPEEFGAPSLALPRLSMKSHALLQSAHTRQQFIMEIAGQGRWKKDIFDGQEPYSFRMIGSEMSPVIENGDEIDVLQAGGLYDRADCVFLQEVVDGKRLVRVGRLVGGSQVNWIVETFNPPSTFKLSRKVWIEAHPIAAIRRAKAFQRE